MQWYILYLWNVNVEKFHFERTTKLSKRDQKYFFIFLHISYYSYYRVRHLPVEDFIDSLLPPQMEREISGSRLQLVLLSPTLLQVLARNSNTSVMGRFLHPDRVIAIMLGKYLIVNFTKKMLNFQFHEKKFQVSEMPKSYPNIAPPWYPSHNGFI